MYNPFSESAVEPDRSEKLVSLAKEGDMKAMEKLIEMHQSWIYNITVNMTGDMETSRDITQEVMIKVITKLSTYKPEKASFRTWLYRIAANHIINIKVSHKEKMMLHLAEEKKFDKFIENIPDTRRSNRPEHPVVTDEIKTACLHCLILCLDRKERLVFTLGAVFGVGDKQGSGICGVSNANYRKILSRTREKVNRFFVNNCSLVKESNPCRCGDKAVGLEKLGMISKEGLAALAESGMTIGEVTGRAATSIEDSFYEFRALFSDQPFYKGPDMTLWLKKFTAMKDIQLMLKIT